VEQQLNTSIEEAEKIVHRSACFQRAFRGEGEEVLEEIDLFCSYKGNCFSKDPYETAFKNGQRSVAVFIHNLMEKDVVKATRAIEEAKKKRGEVLSQT
jgi:hypothetical protein